MLKTWIASSTEEKKKYADPFSIFDQLLVPNRQSSLTNCLQYLELQTIIDQNRKFICQMTSEESKNEEAEEILNELYSEEISHSSKQAQ